MSDSDDSAVLVEKRDVAAAVDAPPDLVDENEMKENKFKDKDDDAKDQQKQKPRACQIVSIIENKEDIDAEKKEAADDKKKKKDGDNDTDDDDRCCYAFHFEKENLQQIVNRIPSHYKVSVVSVVGAFRTGKSFLLSWFLRYLHYRQQKREKRESTTSSQMNKSDRDNNEDEQQQEPWYKSFTSIGNDGFDWRAGSERNTTGIWMWSHPFLIPGDAQTDPIAVLLVDTQGMFDHETTMKLTACIFGFSTLLSSYQIYNVDKRIQEDHLQQLALFSEYARAAVQCDEKEKRKKKKEEEEEEEEKPKSDKSKSLPPKPKQPFQHIEFLVRDWQHFEHDDEDDEDKIDYAALQTSMDQYLDKVLAEREAKDLKETREQIFNCFSQITCYALCHPGFAVTKKKYTGNIENVEPMFLHLLDRYCQQVFSTESSSLQPKKIHGRELTGPELFAYIEAYAALFKSGAKFPTAATMLDATAAANNTNATQLALQHYEEIMDRVSGPKCSNYIRPEELREEHAMAQVQCLELFDNIANFGNQTSIDDARCQVENGLSKKYKTYNALNDSRNPLAGIGTYAVPIVLAVAAMFCEWLANATCSPYSTVCRAFSEFAYHTYAVVLCFLAIVGFTKAKQLQDFFHKFAKAMEVITTAPPSTSAAAGGGAATKAKAD